MSFKKASLAAMLAVSMSATPVIAQTAAAPVTADVRSGAEMDQASALNGGWFIPLLAALAVIAGIVFLVDDGGDRPVSP